jgi:hypothetical protein
MEDDTIIASSSDNFLLLPAPDQSSENTSNELSSISDDGITAKLDFLGPIIVNTDGTLSRIPNWAQLSDIERAKTLRLIAKRNKSRMDSLKENPPVDASENIES